MSGQIPVVTVVGLCLPQAWERAVLSVYRHGVEIATEYDKSDDLPSLDATAVVTVQEPMADPRIHKNFPGGPQELEVYRQEVVDGIHDHWIDPGEGKWTYTYHKRLSAYWPELLSVYSNGERSWDRLEDSDDPYNDEFAVDQLAWMASKLAEAPHTRRAQAITWMPTCDPETQDPPCLQRIWARLVPVGEYDGACFGSHRAVDKACQRCQIQNPCEQRKMEIASGKSGYVLDMNTHWRSRDLYKAWFMNAFAMTNLQAVLAARVSKLLGAPVSVGRYVDISDSLHIYGSYRTPAFEAEIAKMHRTNWKERAVNMSDWEPIFEEVRAKLAKDPDCYAKGDS